MLGGRTPLRDIPERLDHLVGKVPAGVHGVDRLVETTYGELERAVKADMLLTAELRNQNTQGLVDRAALDARAGSGDAQPRPDRVPAGHDAQGRPGPPNWT